MTSPVLFTIDYETELEGVPIPAGSTIAVVPMQVTVQWFVDNPTPSDENAPIWLALVSPERRTTTKRQISEAIRELQLVMDSEKRAMSLARVRQHKTVASAQKYFDESPKHAVRYNQAKDIRRTLYATKMQLDLIYEDLKRKLS